MIDDDSDLAFALAFFSFFSFLPADAAAVTFERDDAADFADERRLCFTFFLGLTRAGEEDEAFCCCCFWFCCLDLDVVVRVIVRVRPGDTFCVERAGELEGERRVVSVGDVPFFV